MPTGTLTIHQSFGPLIGLAAITRDDSANPGEAVYVTVGEPTLRMVFTLDTLDSTLATSFIVTDGGSALYAEAEYAVSLAALDAALQSANVPAALTALFGSLLVIALQPDAQVDLATLKAGLTLQGNDLGTTFVITEPSATVHAGDGNDSITGSTHSDSIDAAGGNDTIIGGGGGDIIDAGDGDDDITITGGAGLGSVNGGAGEDTLVFANRPGSVDVLAAAKTITFNDEFLLWQGEWSFDGIEYFRGSAGLEQFFGNGEGMRFEGGGGRDNFYRGGEVFGDTADYSGEAGTNGIIVNLGGDLAPSDPSLDEGLAEALEVMLGGEDTLPAGAVRDTFGDIDVIDTGFVIVGTSRGDLYYGWTGADVFHAGGGNDHIFGGDGDDTITGGEGDDTFYLSLNQGAYDVTYASGVFTIAGDGGTDIVSGVETFSFAGDTIAAASFEPAPPIAANDSNGIDAVIEAAVGVASDATATGYVLDNDDDADDDLLTVVGARAGTGTDGFALVGTSTVIAGTYGSLTLSGDGSWTYTLNDLLVATNALQPNTTAHETFTYRVSDGALFDVATLDIAIAGSNDAPTAGHDGLLAGPHLEDLAITIAPSTLLANDTDADAGQVLSIASVGGAQHGTVALVSGNVVFMPDANYSAALCIKRTKGGDDHGRRGRVAQGPGLALAA
ncbi:MAG: Ig-like domain-containing protein [Devosia sp.]